MLVVTTWFPTPASPVTGTFVRQDARMLAADHDVTVLHLAPSAAFASAPRHERDGDLDIWRVRADPGRPDQLIGARRMIRQLLQQADLVHTMAFSSILPFAVRRPQLPWVHTEHWSGFTAPHSLPVSMRLAMGPLKRLIALPDVVAPVCEFLARPIRTLRRGPVLVAPCIVPTPANLIPRRAHPDPLRLVAVGGLVPGKDPLTAIDTVDLLRSRGLAATLTWVGDGPLRSDVAAKAAALGLTDAVTLAGACTPAEVRAELDKADLFVLPTRFENFCVSAAEALSHGRPVVIGAVGGQGEYITDAVGALVQQQSPAAYADAVQQVLDLVTASAPEISATVADRFSVAAVRERYRELYAIAAQAASGRLR